jgi:hypothetical protein
LCITHALSKQKSENFEKKGLRVTHNVRIIHANKKQKFIQIYGLSELMLINFYSNSSNFDQPFTSTVM